MKKIQKRINFSKWVYRCAGGPMKVSKDLNVDRKSIYDWMSGESSPTVDRVKKIIELSKGKLSLKDF